MKQYYHFQNKKGDHVFVAADHVIAIKEAQFRGDHLTLIVTRNHSYVLDVPVGLIIQNIINGKNDAVIRIDLEPVKTKPKK